MKTLADNLAAAVRAFEALWRGDTAIETAAFYAMKKAREAYGSARAEHAAKEAAEAALSALVRQRTTLGPCPSNADGHVWDFANPSPEAQDTCLGCGMRRPAVAPPSSGKDSSQ